MTAASRGLGKAAAMELAREGCRVAISARSERIEAAKEIRASIGAEVLAQRADLTRPYDVTQFAEVCLRI